MRGASDRWLRELLGHSLAILDILPSGVDKLVAAGCGHLVATAEDCECKCVWLYDDRYVAYSVGGMIRTLPRAGLLRLYIIFEIV